MHRPEWHCRVLVARVCDSVLCAVLLLLPHPPSQPPQPPLPTRRFKDAHSARLAFDQAVLRVRGVAAKLNYPPGTYQLNCKLVDEKVDAVLRKQAAAASQAAAVPENEKQQGAAAGSGADSHPQHDGPPQLAEQQQEQQVAPHGAWRSSLVPNGPPPQQLCAAACGAAACDALAAGGQAGVSDLDIDEGLLEQLLGEQCSDPSGLPGTPSALTASGDSGSGCWPLAAAGAATPWSPLLPPDWTDALPAAEPDDTAVLQLPALGVPRPPVFGSTGAGTSSSSGQSGCMPPAAAAAVLAGTAADSERAQQAGAGEPPAGRCSNSLVVAQAASGEPRTHEMVVLVRTRAIRAPPAGAAAATAGAQLVRASPTAPGAAGGSSSAGSSTVALTRGIAAAPQAAGPPAGPARQQQLVRMPASDVWVLLARARSHELPRSMRQRMHAMLLAHMRELFQQPLSIDGAEATAARLARKRPAPTC